MIYFRVNLAPIQHTIACSLYVIIFTFIFQSTTSQTVWEKVNYSQQEHRFTDIVVNDDSCYYVLSGYSAPGLHKFDKNGIKTWSKSGYGCCGSLIKGHDQYLYAFGMDTCLLTSTNQLFVVKYDLNGDTVWTRKLGTSGTAVMGCEGYNMTDTTMIVVASSYMYSSSQQLTLIKLDTSGSIIWGYAYEPYQFGSNVVEHDGDILIGTKYYQSGFKYGVLSLNSVGIVIDDEEIYLEIDNLHLDQDNNCIASNYNEIFKLDTALNVVWQRDLDTVHCSHSIFDDADLYFTGRYENNAAHRKDQVYFGKVHALDGSIEWWREYGGIKDEIGEKICFALDGGFIMAGSSKSWPEMHEQGYLVKTDNLGYTSACSDSLAFSPDSILICVGDQAYIQNNSVGSSAPYIWFFDGDSIHSGWYPLIYTNDSVGHHSLQLVSCNDTLETLFNVLLRPDPKFDFIIYDDSVQFFSNSNDMHYWEFGDGGWSYDKDPMHTYEESGTYLVSHTLGDGKCWDIADTLVTVIISEIEEIAPRQILLYPNPTDDFIYIQNPGFEQMMIYNMSGQRIIHYYLLPNQKKQEFDISDLMPGIYILRFLVDDTEVNYKLIKN